LALTCGIIGLSLVGKTTLFNLLTQSEAETSAFAGRTKTNVRTAPIPDTRLDYLRVLYHPRKFTPAALEVIDVPGLVRGSGGAFLAAVREVDALIHVVRAFRSDEVIHVEESLEPVRDLEAINAELLLADMQMVETRLERIATGKKIKGETVTEQATLKICLQALEEEKPLSEAGLTDEQWASVRSLGFLTVKPMIVVINIDEDQLHAGSYDRQAEVKQYLEAKGIPVLTICVELEGEIVRLEAEERQDYLKEMGIAEPGVDRLARAIYRCLGLISFLTAGEDEVRAWTIKEGTCAKLAAGKIHSDIERGFIRAEVVKYGDLVEAGEMSKVKEKGLAHLEGKEYVVQDGDIINFRFNI
jgi:GTP-binding protein YchF